MNKRKSNKIFLPSIIVLLAISAYGLVFALSNLNIEGNLPAPTIDSLSASSGSTLGGETLTVSGSGFATSANFYKTAQASESACGLTRQGSVYCWGRNDQGQLGNDATTDSAIPVKVENTTIDKNVIDIVAGDKTMYALLQNGTVYAWGLNLYGQIGDGTTINSSVPVQVDGLSGVTNIAAGKFSAYAVSGGAIYAWGYNADGQLGVGDTTDRSLPVAVAGDLAERTITLVAAGDAHALAITDDNQLFSWGSNIYGQLGNGTTTSSNSPISITTSTTPIDVVAGLGYSLYLGDDGSIYAWGNNSNGQLGDGTTTQRTSPVAVAGDLTSETVSQISAGDQHTVALTASGAVYAWGYNNNGQLGDLTTTQRTVPTLVDNTGILAGSTVESVSAGGNSSSVTLSDGMVASWGWNLYGQLGNQSTASALTPSVLRQPNYSKVLLGGTEARVLNVSDGSITFIAPAHAAGTVDLQLLADGVDTATANNIYTYVASSNSPAPTITDISPNVDTLMGGTTVTITGSGFAESGRFSKVAVGGEHACGVTTSGKVYCWGRNDQGQLGTGSTTDSTKPLLINGELGNRTVTDIVLGHSSSYAITSNGSVYAWGWNLDGQLGDGTTVNSSSPVRVVADNTFTKLAAGYNHACGLTSLNEVLCWGSNTNGQFGDGTTTSSSSPKQSLLSQETLGASVTDITAGYGFTLAVASGSVYGAGANTYGQLGNGNSLQYEVPVRASISGAMAGQTITTVEAGSKHAVALSDTGVVYAWGSNTTGELGNNSTTTRNTPAAVTTASTVLSGKTVSQIAAGYNHSCALTTDNVLACWGSNANSQLGNGTITNSIVPTVVNQEGNLSGKNVTALSSGGSTTGVVTSDNSLLTWGWNLYGQLGDNTLTDRQTAVTLFQYPFSQVIVDDLEATVTGLSSTSITFVSPAHPAGTVDITVSGDGIDSVTAPNSFTYEEAEIAPPPTINGLTPTSGPTIGGDTVTVTGEGLDSGSRFARVDGGNRHTCGLTDTGGIYCWGSNLNGQLGNGTTDDSSVPTRVAGELIDKMVIQIALGDSTSYALTSGGEVYAWGYNSNGQLGDGTTVDSLIPKRVNGLSGIRGIAAGSWHACATNTTSTYCWGLNGGGQLGNGTTIDSRTPTMPSVIQGKTITQLVAGDTFTLALANDGAVYAWGRNNVGQLGSGNNTDRSTPTTITASGAISGRSIIELATSGQTVYALDNTGLVYAWGYNGNGQIGNSTTTNSNLPVAVTTSGVLDGKTIVKIAAGDLAGYAVDDSGEVYAWGYNGNGQLGNGTNTNSSSAVAVSKSAEDVVTNIGAGNSQACMITSEGRLSCWGWNLYGQLGIDNRIDSSTAIAVIPGLTPMLGDAVGRVLYSSPTELIFATTAHPEGLVDFTLSASGVETASLANAYTYVGPPSITSLSPSEGSKYGGDSVIILGSRLDEVTEVRFGGATATILDATENSLTVSTPSHAVGTVDVAIEDAFGQISTLQASFTYLESPPVITSLSPNKGPISGGQEVTITGAEFQNEANTTVRFGDLDATSFSLESSTTIRAVTPEHVAGMVDVTVINYDDQFSTLSNAYEYVAPPSITSIEPNESLINTSNVIYVFGTSFSDQTTVRFGDLDAQVTFIDDTTLMVNTPISSTPGTVDVIVADEFGQSSILEGGFTYKLPEPVISSVSPVYAKMQGGSQITISGSDFVSSGSADNYYDFSIDGVPLTGVTVVNSSTITANLPAHALGTVDIDLSGEYITSTVIENAVTYLPDAYAFLTDPQTVMATQPAEFVIEARDSSGQAVTGPETIVIHLSSSTTTGAFARSLEGEDSGWNYSTVIIPAGSSQATFYYRDNLKTTATITVADNLPTTASQDLEVQSRYKLLVTGVSDPTNVGIPSSVTIQAIDYQGIPQSDYTGTVSFSSTDGAATLPSNYTFAASDYGSHTFTNGVVFLTQGLHNVTVTDADDDIITGTQYDIDVGYAPEGETARLKFITEEQSFPLDNESDVITVQLQDAADAPVVTTSDTTIYIRTDSATGSFSTDGGETWTNGPLALTVLQYHSSANFLYRDTTAGTYNLKVSQFADNDFGWDIDTQEIMIGLGIPVAYKFYSDEQTIVKDTASQPIILGLVDQFGDPTAFTEDSGLASLTTDSSTGEFSLDNIDWAPISEVEFPVGQLYVTVYYKDSQVSPMNGYELTISDQNLDLASQMIRVLDGEAVKLSLDMDGLTTIVAGEYNSVKLKALTDDDREVVVLQDVEVTLDSDQGDFYTYDEASQTYTPVQSVTLAAETSQLQLYYRATVAGSYILRAEADALEDAELDIEVVDSGLFKLVYTTLPDARLQVATASAAFVVSAQDIFGNVVVIDDANPTDVVIESSNDLGQFSLQQNGGWGINSVQITAGNSTTEPFYYTNGVIEDGALTDAAALGNQTITASLGDSEPAEFEIEIVGHIPNDINFETDPQTLEAGERSQLITVRLTTADGQPAIATNNQTINLSSLNLNNDNVFPGVNGQDEFTNTDDEVVTSITVPAGSSSASFYVTPKTAINHRIAATAPIYNYDGFYVRAVRATQNLNVTVGPTARLTVTSQKQIIYPTLSEEDVNLSGPIVVALTDDFGNLATNDQDRTVSLSSSCATGSFVDQDSSEITSIVMPESSNSVTVFYKDSQSHADDCQLSFSSSGLITAVQDITVQERVQSLAIISPAQTIEAGQTSEFIVVESRDRFGNTVTTLEDLDIDFTADNQLSTLLPNSGTIPAGMSQTQFRFRYAQPVSEPTDITVTAADPDSNVASASQIVTVTPGEPASLSWSQSSVSQTVGEYRAVTVRLLNAYGVITNTEEDISVDLSNDAGTNSNLGTAAGKFYLKVDEEYQEISTITIEAGSSQTENLYYAQTITTKSRAWAWWYNTWVESNSPDTVTASSDGLNSGTYSVTVEPLRLNFSPSSLSAQSGTYTALKVTMSGSLPTDLDIDLTTSASSSSGGFYSQADGSGGQITSTTIEAGETESPTIYYSQTIDVSPAPGSVSANLRATAVSPVWSTWFGEGTATIWLGSVNEVIIYGPDELEQNQPGEFIIETRDEFGNLTPLVPYRYGYQQSAPACLYVRVDSSQANLVGSPSSTCPNPIENGVVAITMPAGVATATVQYSDMATGQHTLTASNLSSGSGSLTGTTNVNITPAQTVKLSFDRAEYGLVRGDTLNASVKLMSQYDVEVNTLGMGDITISLASGSDTAEFSQSEGWAWQSSIDVVIPSSQTSASFLYRDNDADFGSSQITAMANGLSSASANVNIITGNLAAIEFLEPNQVLQRGQTGQFEFKLLDEFGNETAIASDTCLYVLVGQSSASITGSTGSNCNDVTLPDGSISKAVLVTAGSSRGSFSLMDTEAGEYQISLSTQPTGGGIAVVDNLSIIDGEISQIAFSDTFYQIERGGTVDINLEVQNDYGIAIPATEDMYFNLDSSSQTAEFTTNDSSASVMIAAGQSSATFNYGDSQPVVDSYLVTASSDNFETAETDVYIVYGTPVGLEFITPARSTVATHPSEVMTVQLVNQYGYSTIATSDTTFYLRGGSQTGAFAGADGQFGVTSLLVAAGQSGVDFRYRDSTAGIYQLAVSDSLDVSQLTATQSHEITRQVLSHFRVTNISTPQKAGTPSSAVVFAVDSDDYPIEWYDGTIYFSADSDDAVFPTEGYTFDPASDRGIHTFTNAIAFREPGIKAISVADSSGIRGTQYNIIVEAGNEQPVRSIEFIAPSVKPTTVSKDSTSQAMTLQLRDSTGAPTNSIVESGYPIRLTSSSSTGLFATDPDGEWTSEIIVVVEQGLSFTLTPVYYKDSQAGSHTITATDWLNGADDPSVINATLEVIVLEITTEDESRLMVQDYSGQYIENLYLFSRSSAELINGYLQAMLYSRDSQTGDLIVGDWNLQLSQSGQIIDSYSESSASAINYQTPELTPTRQSDDYSLVAEVATEYLQGLWIQNIAVSPYLAQLSDQSFAAESGILSFGLTARNGDSLSDHDNINFSLTGSGYEWALNSLLSSGRASRTSPGQYRINIPISDLEAGEYQLVVSMEDAFGTLAQDAVWFTAEEVDQTDDGSTTEPEEPGEGGTVPDDDTGDSTDDDEAEIPGDDDDGDDDDGSGSLLPDEGDEAGTETETGDNIVLRFLRSPYAPTAVAGGILFGLIIVAVVLLYQIYKEYRQAKWLLGLVKKNNQLVDDKDAFLMLASHHLRTPISLIDASLSIFPVGRLDRTLVDNVKASLSNLSKKADLIIDKINTSPKLGQITVKSPKVAQRRILLSPVFWLPVILSVVLTLILNWAIMRFGGQSIGGIQIVNQLALIIAGILIIYISIRSLVIQRERRQLIKDLDVKADSLNSARNYYVQAVQASLTDDVVRLSAYNQEITQYIGGTGQETFSDGVDRLEKLISRFATLSSLDQSLIRKDVFEFGSLVDQAVKESSREIDTSGLVVENHTKDLKLHQDKRLLGKVFETIIASMTLRGRSSKLTIKATKKSNATNLTVTSPISSELPAENLFSIYSRSDNELAGTSIDPNDQDMQRLDLYMDRIIMNSLGGDIKAIRSNDLTKVTLTVPA